MNAAQLHEHWRVLSRAADDAYMAWRNVNNDLMNAHDQVVRLEQMLAQAETLVTDLQDYEADKLAAWHAARDIRNAAWDAYQAAD